MLLETSVLSLLTAVVRDNRHSTLDSDLTVSSFTSLYYLLCCILEFQSYHSYHIGLYLIVHVHWFCDVPVPTISHESYRYYIPGSARIKLMLPDFTASLIVDYASRSSTTSLHIQDPLERLCLLSILYNKRVFYHTLYQVLHQNLSHASLISRIIGFLMSSTSNTFLK